MGIITHVQRMSLHDGPGIRSTVFLKGCNMRCIWCHNPETFSKSKELEWIEDRCMQCNLCVQNCPTGAFYIYKKRVHFNKEKCRLCFKCIDSCFTEAIHVVGEEISSKELITQLLLDKEYFEQSQGGITLSGGEPLFQKAFCKEVLVEAKQHMLHTAIETNLSLPWEKYVEVLPWVDYLMVDLKIIDSSKHKKYTGIENYNVKQNLLLLDKQEIPYEVRTPIIPSLNDSKGEIVELNTFISQLKNCTKYTLLPYHTLGNIKYTQLGIANPMEGAKAMSKDQIQLLQSLIK